MIRSLLSPASAATLIVGVFLFAASTGDAQEDSAAESVETEAAAAEAAPTEPPAIEATTATDPEIATALLEAQLRPLTLEEVETELDAWLSLLKDKASEISAAKIANAELSGNALAEAEKQVVEMRGERADLVERARIVAIELEAKGGDPTNANLYIDQVSSPVRPSGIASTLASAQAWMTSADGGVAFGVNLLKFFGCLIAGWTLGAILAKVLDKSLAKVGKTSDLLRSFLVKAIRRVAVFVGLIIGLSYLGVNIGPLMAAIGAAGLVIGLALQGTLSNFASGLLILFYEPFDVGDVVQAGGITGKVQSMTLVNTVFNTADNQVVVVPNSKIWDDTITNVTASDTRRIDLVVGIGYDDDIEKAKTVLADIVAAHDGVLEDPAPQIAVSELGASSVDLVVRPWCRTPDYWNVRFELTQTIKQRFDDEGISFPFPQQDVHMHQVVDDGSSTTGAEE